MTPLSKLSPFDIEVFDWNRQHSQTLHIPGDVCVCVVCFFLFCKAYFNDDNMPKSALHSSHDAVRNVWLSSEDIIHHTVYLSLHFHCHISMRTWVSWHQNVSILDFIGAKDDGGGGDNWSYKTCKAPVKHILSISVYFCPMENKPVRKWCRNQYSDAPRPQPLPLSSCSQPWIFLVELQACVQDSFLAETAFGLQYQRRGSCHTLVFTWWLRISGRSSSGMEHVTAQCHLRAISLFTVATSENFSV